jgi:lipid-binding SYLF domain-containing protein
MPNSFSLLGYIAAALSFCALLAQPLSAQSREEATVTQSIEVFKAIDKLAIQGIPRELLRDAHAIAIIPNVIKGSLVIGMRRGHGVLLVRDEQTRWGAPIFVTLTGGNIGWQVGVQSTDVILVFKSRRSIDGIFNGKFTLGVDAAAAAGPIGRQAAAGTDSQLKAEIYSYSRSRGLFAGVSFDGSKIQIDPLANSEYYKPVANAAANPPKTNTSNIPQSAIDLVQLLTLTTNTESSNNNPLAGSAILPSQNMPAPINLPGHLQLDEAAAIRQQIQTIAPQLFDLLDPQWQQYLALPNELFAEESVANTEALKKVLDRYELVRANPQYTQLASRKEFQTLHQLLKHYIAIEEKSPPSLILPPPPGGPSEPQ